MKWILIFTITLFPLLVRSQSNLNYPIDKDKLESIVKTLVKEQGVPGLAIGIVVNDRLEHFFSFGYADKIKKTPIDEYTGFQIGSLTKPLIATLAMKMYSDGKINIHQPIQDYLPNELIPNSSIPITLAHLLSHSSGLPQEPINRIDLPNTPTVPKPYSKIELYTGLKNTDLLFIPGTYVQYSNLGLMLAGHILEEVAKQPLEELLKNELLVKLDMTSTYAQKKPEKVVEASHYWRLDDAIIAHPRWEIGEIWGNGGITSNMNDMSKYLSIQFKRSNSNPSFIPPEYLILSQTPRVPANRFYSEFLGLGWYINRDEHIGTHVYHSGDADGHSSYISFSPEDGIGLIVFANMGGVADEIGEEILELVYLSVSEKKKSLSSAFYNSNWDLVINSANELIEINPSNSRAHYFLGKALVNKNLYDQAIKHLEIAIQDGIYIDHAYFYLASCMASKKENEIAYNYLTKAVNLGFIDGDVLLKDENLNIFSERTSYKKLARWGHHH